MNTTMKPIEFITSIDGGLHEVIFTDNSTKYFAVDSYDEQTKLVRCHKLEKAFECRENMNEDGSLTTFEEDFEYFLYSDILEIHNIPVLPTPQR